MRRVLDLPLLVILMGIASVVMYVPALHAYSLRDHATARPFLYGGTVLLAITVMIGVATLNRSVRDAARGHLVALLGAYLVLPVMLALPFHQAVPGATVLGSWFEMMSSLTTTGATLYPKLGDLSPTVHLWRSLVGWFGGLLSLIAAMAILAPMNLGGAEVVSGLAPGGGRADLRLADPSERIARQAALIFPIYTGLTLLLWAVLTLLGESGFVALCHAMATLSSSGISPVGGLAGSQAGPGSEVVMFLFMFFAVSRRILPGAGALYSDRSVAGDPEVRLAAIIIGTVTVLLILRHWVWVFEPDPLRGVPGILRAAWGAAFTSLSFLTTGGFVSQDWPETRFWSDLGAPGLILSGLAMMGGGVATTAGGIKLFRVYALFRHGQRQIERQVHPSSVGGSGVAARLLRRDGAYLAWVFLILFGLTVALVALSLAATGQPFEPALAFSIAALTNTGPLAAASGFAYGDLTPTGQGITGFAMIIGRIETLAILVLFTTERWRG